ncbi:MAG: hypothetical protein A4E40_00629 [Methanoregulaceae archaeon PtaU1.Bin059]|nr:MAG: hypothetical protein A4E40_00629 [Methanoregulaceae archaeon PtaU1.Bin059]
MTILNFPSFRRYLMSFGVSIVGQGQTTAPSFISAITKTHHSGTLGRIRSTRSPFWMPYLIRMFAAWLERFFRSRNENFFSSFSWFTQIIASLFRSFSAHESMTSKPKL